MAIVSDRLQQYQKSVEEIHNQIEVSTAQKDDIISLLTTDLLLIEIFS